MFETDNDIITITPKNSDSRWVTLDQNNNILSEGKTPEEAINAAKEKSDNYTLLYVPIEGNACFF